MNTVVVVLGLLVALWMLERIDRVCDLLEDLRDLLERAEQ